MMAANRYRLPDVHHGITFSQTARPGMPARKIAGGCRTTSIRPEANLLSFIPLQLESRHSGENSGILGISALALWTAATADPGAGRFDGIERFSGLRRVDFSKSWLKRGKPSGCQQLE